MKRVRVLGLLLLLIVASCGDKHQKFVVMAYNVENLFDTEDDPKVRDNDFLPIGKYEWTEERYNDKLLKLSRVIELQSDVPDLIALEEIENRKVLEDLVNQAAIDRIDYQIVHQDSPDRRGIDVALLYNPKTFKVIDYELISVFDSVSKLLSRDILYVKGQTVGTDTLHVFVNHWPSRMGGQKKSDPKRAHVARILREKVDEVLLENPNAKILITGDFNDEPIDDSVLKVLHANGERNSKNPKELYNLMWKAKASGRGTYLYKNKWNMIDHIIVSRPLLNASKGLHCTSDTALIFKNQEIVEVNRKGIEMPKRTYKGSKNYNGGTSDHFPVLVTLEIEAEKVK